MNFGKLSKFAMALTIGATLAACGNGDGTTAESGAETGSTTATGSGTDALHRGYHRRISRLDDARAG